MRSFAVSALREPPFPARRHAAIDQVAGESTGWARDLGPGRPRPGGCAGCAGPTPPELAGRACPDAPVDRLRLLTDLITWLFVMDDACDEDGLGADPARLAPTVAALLEVLTGTATRTARPAGRRRSASRWTTCAGGSAPRDRPALLLRLVSQLREYLLALLWEAANREHRRVPGVAEYVQMRRHTGGVRPSFTLTDLAYDGLPGAGRRADPALVALDGSPPTWSAGATTSSPTARSSAARPDAHNLVTAIAGESRRGRGGGAAGGGGPVQRGPGHVRRAGGGADRRRGRRRCAPSWRPAGTGSGPPTTGRSRAARYA